MDWLQVLTGAGVITALGTALATHIRTRPAMKLAQVKGEEALWKEIASLRADVKAAQDAAHREREICDERIARMEERNSADISEIKREFSVARHDRNNIRMAFNFVVASIKRIDLPEMQSIAEEAEAMIARGEQTIAIEKAGLLAEPIPRTRKPRGKA